MNRKGIVMKVTYYILRAEVIWAIFLLLYLISGEIWPERKYWEYRFVLVCAFALGTSVLREHLRKRVGCNATLIRTRTTNVIHWLFWCTAIVILHFLILL